MLKEEGSRMASAGNSHPYWYLLRQSLKFSDRQYHSLKLVPRLISGFYF